MSTPWRLPFEVVTPSPVHGYYSALLVDGHLVLEGSKEFLEHVARAVNAFDALLAVAKAYAGGLQKQIGPGVYQSCLKCGQPTLDVLHMSGCPIEPLDRDHPDWREWA